MINCHFLNEQHGAVHHTVVKKRQERFTRHSFLILAFLMKIIH